MRGELFIASALVAAGAFTGVSLMNAERSHHHTISDVFTSHDGSRVASVDLQVPVSGDVVTVSVPGDRFATEEELLREAARSVSAQFGDTDAADAAAIAADAVVTRITYSR